jgi:hypothetical protein
MVGFMAHDAANPLIKAMEEEKFVYNSDEDADHNYLSA